MLMKMMLLASFGVLQVLDVLTTNRVLNAGGWEANPIGVWAMMHLGMWWFVPKLAAMALCLLVISRWRTRFVAAPVALMAIVVANNAIQ